MLSSKDAKDQIKQLQEDLQPAYDSATNATKYIEEIKEARDVINNMLNITSTITLAENYKKAQKQYKTTVWDYVFFLVPLAIILVYLVYPGALWIKPLASDKYICYFKKYWGYSRALCNFYIWT